MFDTEQYNQEWEEETQDSYEEERNSRRNRSRSSGSGQTRRSGSGQSRSAGRRRSSHQDDDPYADDGYYDDDPYADDDYYDDDYYDDDYYDDDYDEEAEYYKRKARRKKKSSKISQTQLRLLELWYAVCSRIAGGCFLGMGALFLISFVVNMARIPSFDNIPGRAIFLMLFTLLIVEGTCALYGLMAIVKRLFAVYFIAVVCSWLTKGFISSLIQYSQFRSSMGLGSSIPGMGSFLGEVNSVIMILIFFLTIFGALSGIASIVIGHLLLNKGKDPES